MYSCFKILKWTARWEITRRIQTGGYSTRGSIQRDLRTHPYYGLDGKSDLLLCFNTDYLKTLTFACGFSNWKARMEVFINELLNRGGKLMMMSGRSSLVFILLSAAGILSLSVSSSKSFEVVVFGSTAIDFVAYTNVLPQKGETVFGTSFSKNFGGKGANQVSKRPAIFKY